MAFDPQQAARDENAKLRLEAQFRPEIRRHQNALATEVTRSLAEDGRLPDVAAIEAESLRPVLRRHYSRVADVFDGRLAGQMPDDVAMSDEERAALAAALLLLFDRRAPQQADVIGARSAKNARRAVALANQESARIGDAESRVLSLREEAVIAGTIFSRALRGRTSGIVTLETQAPAEAAKLQEAMVLTGVGGLADEPAVSPPLANQRWMTQGDNLVRTSPGTGHIGADSQVVPIGVPFLVGGQRLLYPGDTSLGATIDNVAGCRCSAVQDVAQIVDLRRAA